MNAARSPALRARALALAAVLAIEALAGACSEPGRDRSEGKLERARASSEPVPRAPPLTSETAAAAHAAGSLAAQPRDTLRQAPRVRVVAVAGQASSRAEAPGPAGALAVGQTFERAARIELGRGAHVELALDDYVALRIQGPAMVSLLPDGEPALLVREGLVAVDCARTGRAGASPLWLALPTGRIEIADSVRLVVRAHALAASPLAVVSGHALVEPTDSAQEPTLLGPSEARCLGSREARPWSGHFTTLEAAEQALATSAPCAPDEVATEMYLTSALASALSQVDEAGARERTLLAEHARRVAARWGSALEVQAKLARSAASLQRARQKALALRAQLSALLLGGAPTQDENALLERARRVLPPSR